MSYNNGSSFTPLDVVSTTLADISEDFTRRYLAVIATTNVTITISGGIPFTVQAGGVWAPVPAPSNDIVMVGTGVLLLG